MSKHYFKSDGNGGYNIGKYTISLIAIVVLIIGMLIPICVSAGRNNNRIENLENAFVEAGPRHTEVIDSLGDNIEINNIKIAVILEKLDGIDKHLIEISKKLD